MKLRIDLLEYLTDEDILEAAEASVSRFSAEPVFGRTGVGFLRPASEEEKAAEIVASERMIQRILARAEADAQRRASASLDSSGR